MARAFAQLVRIDQDREIRKDTDYEAYYHIEHGLLLALRDSGTLSDIQFRFAEEALKQQRSDRAKKSGEENI